MILISNQWPSRALIKAQIEEEGHRVTGFELVEEALAPLQQGYLAPDAIILDTMGQPDGQKALAQLEDAIGSVPIIVLTGPFDKAQMALNEEKFQRVLARPFFIRDVVQAVKVVLRAPTDSSTANGP